jgi:hypothetical protein
MSDDDDGDVVVIQVCAAVGCASMQQLTFDEETGEMYCAECAEKLQAADTDGYDTLLSSDDVSAVNIIFYAFDKDEKEYWTFREYNAYLEATSTSRKETHVFASNDEMAEYMLDEYDVKCGEVKQSLPGEDDSACLVVRNIITVKELRTIYGGYMYNGINALREDLEVLEDEGFINTAMME